MGDGQTPGYNFLTECQVSAVSLPHMRHRVEDQKANEHVWWESILTGQRC